MTSSRNLLTCALVSAALSSAGFARAEAPTRDGDADRRPDDVARSRVVVDALVGGQVNPPGVLVRAGIAGHATLARREGVDYEDAYLEGGAALTATPAYVAPRVHGEWSPAPWFVLRGEYELLGFTGVTRGLLSLDSRDADFGEAALSASRVRAGLGHKLQLSPVLRARFGPAVMQERVDAAYYRYTGDGPCFYEVQHDSLIARGDLVTDARTDVLFDVGGLTRRSVGLLVGPSYSLTRAWRTEVQRQRVGGALAFTPAGAWGPLRRPTLLLDVGVNAEDRNRAGQPFAAIGVSAELR